MTLLTDREWRLKYTPEDGDLTAPFYVPALSCAVRYDRSTGFFSASALALAMRGIEGLVRNEGRMRLVVGCTLDPPEIEAIEKGERLRDTVERKLAAAPLTPPDRAAHDALELPSWLVAQGILEVKVAIPCDDERRPVPADGIFHEKAGLLRDKAGHRLAFVGSINETEAGWRRNWEKFHVFTSWGGDAERVEGEARDFESIWQGRSKRVITLDVPDAVRRDLLRFLPKDDRPARLKAPAKPEPGPEPEPVEPVPEPVDLRRRVWAYIREAPRLLIADEVGLGKTIQAGMLIRQMWLAGRAKRILILTPAAVMTDTMDFLRDELRAGGHAGIVCFSGRGGEVLGTDGRWHAVSRDDVKRRFRQGRAEILRCTDAAAEGLNFQFCGAVVNYDMPWNPMRVEQRIGRIDRLGQRHRVVRIVNLHYQGTVESDVYAALRARIGLFESVVGKLQPILARLPSRISSTVLQAGGAERERARREIVGELEAEVERARREGGFDLDQTVREALEQIARPRPPLDLDLLDRVIRRPELLPPGIEAKPLGQREYAYLAPGMAEPLRVTTDPQYYEENPESVELWSPGGVVFPAVAEVESGEAGDVREPLATLLVRP